MRHTKKHFDDPAQTELVGIIWQRLRHSYRLHAGDVIRFNGRLGRVLRVNDCAAVILMNRPIREFKTRFDKAVRFQPPPIVFQISPQSEVEILNAQKREAR